MKFTLLLPERLPLKEIYAGINDRKRMKQKQLFVTAVWALRLKPYKGLFPVQIHYDFRYQGKALNSLDGAYMAKLIEDVLVLCNVLPDDNAQLVRRSIIDTGRGKNEVTVDISPLK